MFGQHHCYCCALTVRQRDGQQVIQRYKRRHQYVQVFELRARIIIGTVISTVLSQFSQGTIRSQQSTAVRLQETHGLTDREASISARHDGCEEQRSQGRAATAAVPPLGIQSSTQRNCN
jgi:hypothetical protein